MEIPTPSSLPWEHVREVHEHKGLLRLPDCRGHITTEVHPKKQPRDLATLLSPGPALCTTHTVLAVAAFAAKGISQDTCPSQGFDQRKVKQRDC